MMGYEDSDKDPTIDPNIMVTYVQTIDAYNTSGSPVRPISLFSPNPITLPDTMGASVIGSERALALIEVRRVRRDNNVNDGETKGNASSIHPNPHIHTITLSRHHAIIPSSQLFLEKGETLFAVIEGVWMMSNLRENELHNALVKMKKQHNDEKEFLEKNALQPVTSASSHALQLALKHQQAQEHANWEESKRAQLVEIEKQVRSWWIIFFFRCLLRLLPFLRFVLR